MEKVLTHGLVIYKTDFSPFSLPCQSMLDTYQIAQFLYKGHSGFVRLSLCTGYLFPEC